MAQPLTAEPDGIGVVVGTGAGVAAAVETTMDAARAVGKCFVAGTEVVTAHASLAIEDVAQGDLVTAACTDGGEEAWVEVAPGRAKDSSAWAPRGVCERVKRSAKSATMLAACDVAQMPADVVVVQIYDARTGEWFKGFGAELSSGNTFLDEGRVLRVTEDGVEVRGEAAV